MASASSELPYYTRKEVSEHKKDKDAWIVVDGEVYDVTRWLSRHPGGAKVLMHYAGEDATVSQAFAAVCASIFCTCTMQDSVISVTNCSRLIAFIFCTNLANPGMTSEK